MRTGYRLALGAVAVTIVLAVVLLVAEVVGVTRDASKYGQVPLPGRESVSLPAGDVIIYYGERPDASFPLRAPPNLRLRVRTTNGQELLGSTPYLTGQFHDGDYERRAVAKLRVPEAGAYEAVSTTRVAGAVTPVLSFGRNGTRSFGYVLFVLAGGGLLAAILGGGTALRSRMNGSP
jgi:hypothetical protein